MSKALKTTFYFLLFLAITLTCTNSARILDEVDQQPPIIADAPFPFNPVVTSVPPTVGDDDESDSPLPEPEFPVAAAAPPTADDDENDDLAPVPTPIATSAPLLPTATSTSSTVANSGPQGEPLCFFMHDILGGTRPSARVVTGIIASTEINGIPFSKSNNNLFPINGGTPLINQNNLNNVINPNNVPFLTGLNGAQASTVLQNTGNNNVVNEAHVRVDNGDRRRANGGARAGVRRGRQSTRVLLGQLFGRNQSNRRLTALFHNGNEHDHDHIVDSISFFGVHRTASPHSHIAVIGGTGKYENAKGYAMVESLHQEDQHTTDGVDTIAKFSVYITDE
ncbi:hypothetical protein Dsin_004156 [Dipteronia sinensis]|uniref:Dirigent protein n=1 Tax=Dipteronia sinensis TaxID=43782 RepID=A0AAE0BA91_9ROSI|nr:hypothetical protein Dsin_004156 [Dipteronia sinensis]